MNLRFLAISLLLLTSMLPAGARGKNKIQYDDFEWKIYISPHFKVYYYEAEAHLLESIVDMAEAAYKHVSEKLQHELRFNVPFIAYKTHEEFEQTNIFPNFIPRNLGAFAEPLQSRMVLPLDGGPGENYALIVHELTHIFQYDMLYNNKLSTIIRAEAPTWFTEGMASWVADDEDNLDRMVLRDAAINSNFSSLGAFSGLSYLAYRIGHSAFNFMEERYGIEGVRNFLWQYRKNITGSIGAAIERAFETPVEEFDRDFRKYLRRKYVGLLAEKEEPDDNAREIRTRSSLTTLSPKLSPSGDLYAAIIFIKNELDLVLISTKDGRIFKNLTKGYTNRYTELYYGAFEGVNDLGWSSDGNELAFTARSELTNRLFVVNALSGKITKEVKFDGIREAQSPVFSSDGKTIYFVGNAKGQFDVFSYDRESESINNLTNDAYHDRNPEVAPSGNELLYSSQRDGFYKIFALNLQNREQTQLTSGLGNDIQASYNADMKKIFFSSDRFDDIYNIFSLDLETGEKLRYTNILTGAFAPQERVTYDAKAGTEVKQLIFTSFYQGRYRVYRMDRPADVGQTYEISIDNFENVKDYEMSSNIKLEDARFQKYKPFKTFSISNIAVNVGATDDGRFITNSGLQLSDPLGNHLLDISAYSISDYESYFVQYLNQSDRLQWGTFFQAQQAFVVDRFDPRQERLERRYKTLDAGGLLRYPTSQFTRFDVGAGFQDAEYFNAEFDPDFRYRIVEADYSEPYAFVGFSRDTVRYREFGALQGMALDFRYTQIFGGTSRTFHTTFSTYRQITSRSLFAWRTLYDQSDGDTPQLFSLGGTNRLRGDYEYNEFLGSRRFLTQIEIRFPVIDALFLPGGVGFGNIRASLFADAGSTWFEESDFNFEFQESAPSGVDPGDGVNFFNPDNPNPDYLIGAYGLEISMNLLGLPVHWTWSRRTNFEEFPSNSRLSFWIGLTF